MFKFFIRFKVVTEMDFRGYNEDKELVAERIEEFTDVCKHFSMAYTNSKRVVVKVPGYPNSADSIIKFGTGKILQLSWDCIIAPEKWEEFCSEVNNYVKDKNYATFLVYSAP